MASRPEDEEDKGVETDVEEDDEQDAASIAGTFEEAEEAAWTDIERHLTQMSPYDFQNLVAALLRAMGYHISWIAPPGRDGHIDIPAHTDPVGINMARIKMQVKRRADKISVDGLRSFMALLGDHDVGIVCLHGWLYPGSGT